MNVTTANVALIVDGNAVLGARNTIKSLLLNSSQVAVYVINTGMTDAQSLELQSLSPCVRLVGVPRHLHTWLENFALRGFPHVSKAAYLKLVLHRILAAVDKIVYLDTDTLVLENIANILSSDLDDHFLGATWTATQVDAGKLRLGLKQRYFNSGVMLCNLEKWRANAVEDDFLDWYQTNKSKMKFNDQEVLNGVFDGRNFEIGKRWNVSQREVFFHDATLKIGNISEVGILHFNGAIKYWHQGYKSNVVNNLELFDAVRKLHFDIGFGE